MLQIAVSCAIAACAVGAASRARAQSAPGQQVAPPPQPDPPSSLSGERAYLWYGWQVMLADAASVALGLATEEFGVFATTYVVSGIAVHASNHSGHKAIGSAALRVGLPVGGGLVGLALGNESRDIGYAFLGFGAGLITGTLIDWFAIARRPIARTRVTPAGVTAAPNLAIAGDGVTLGLTGAF